MSTKTKKENEVVETQVEVQEQEQEQVEETAVAVVPSSDDSVMVLNDNVSELSLLPPELLAELTAEIQSDLKSLRIDKLTAPTVLLDQLISVRDAFLMTFSSFASDKDDGQRIVFEVTDEIGLTYFVPQSPSGSRLTFVNVFNNIRKMQRRLTLTNCKFQHVGQGKYGNRPIILQPTESTKYLFA